MKVFPLWRFFPHFIEAICSLRHLKLPPPARIVNQIYPVHALHPTSWISILILSCHLRLELSNIVFPSPFHNQIPVYNNSIRATCPAHIFLLLNHPNNLYTPKYIYYIHTFHTYIHILPTLIHTLHTLIHILHTYKHKYIHYIPTYIHTYVHICIYVGRYNFLREKFFVVFRYHPKFGWYQLILQLNGLKPKLGAVPMVFILFIYFNLFNSFNCLE